MNPLKRMVNRLQERKEEKKAERAKTEKLEKWKQRLERSLQNHDTFRANVAVWDELYNGSKAVGRNLGTYTNYVSERTETTPVDAKSVVNIVFQLIESQIDISIPMPRVNAIEGDDEAERQKMVEGMLTYIAESPELERLVSENERIVRKNGICIYKVHFDPDYQAHKYRGKIKISNPHPINIIPQPNVYRIQDMDYFFHIEPRTLSEIGRMYGKEKREKLEAQSAEYSYLEDMSATTGRTTEDSDRVSVVECWYRDDDGDVGLLAWANDVILKDMPKFYYKRDMEGNIIEYETVSVDEYDENGNLINTQEVQVKCHVPKRYPFIVQYNIPKEKSYYAKSDPEIVKDMQEAIKKLLSIEEEKHIKGTTKIFVKKDSGLKNKLNNATMQILETDNPQFDIRVVDMKTSDNGIKDLYQIYLQAAKDMLGVTEASQGRIDSSSLSGKAIEALAVYSAGRMAVKQFEKNIAFQELYEMCYDFMMAFYDDRIPYRVENNSGDFEYGYFEKGRFIKQDDAGEWYYPELDIYIDIDQGMPKDKKFVMEIINQAAASGVIDQIGYWTIMDAIGVPHAGMILDRLQEMSQGGTRDEIIAQMPPEVRQRFMQLPPDQQEKMIQQAMQAPM